MRLVSLRQCRAADVGLGVGVRWRKEGGRSNWGPPRLSHWVADEG